MPITGIDRFAQALGDCDQCGRSGARVFATDRDGSAPVSCVSCFRDVHDEDPNDEGDDQLTPYAIEEALDAHDFIGDDDDESVGAIVESYSFESDYQPTGPRLCLPELPGRKARMVSVEQEVGMGSNEIAARLHQGGFARYDSRLGYHSSGARTNTPEHFVHVEEDSSVDGEIIYSKMRLDDPTTAARFEAALGVVKGSIQDDIAKLDMRCGLHVHVDAKGYGMAEVESLYHLWNHVEDTVFRLGAANWRCHRTSLASYNYAPPTMKHLDSRAAIGGHFSEGGRGALNLSNFLSSRGNCRCGAFSFAAWQDCTCDLGKSTVEFRVFNATANLRKIHAYTALSLAMVEAARNITFDSSLTAFGFDRHAETIVGSVEIEKTKVALGILFEGLPLTETEREDLAYCARNSAVAEIYEEVYGR